MMISVSGPIVWLIWENKSQIMALGVIGFVFTLLARKQFLASGHVPAIKADDEWLVHNATIWFCIWQNYENVQGGSKR